MTFVDPTPSVEQRVREALAPLEDALATTSDRAARRKIRREMARRERVIRTALSGNAAVW
jgi:hypothetical protein